MDRDLSRSLHRLTARLDRAADRFLRAQAGMSYRRFLALYMVGSEGADTQRALAERLGVSEPSVSRLVGVLADGGWLEAVSEPGAGNRNRLGLTVAGEQVVERWGAELEDRLAAFVDAAAVPYSVYRTHTQQLLNALDSATETAETGPPPIVHSRSPVHRDHA